MSDRIAVFNEGRIEQVGTPEESTSGPRPSSSPASSASRTCSSARTVASPIRPEKIEMAPGDEPARGETGTVKDVIYVGAFTRYIVDLDPGGQLTVMRQNLETTSEPGARGERPARSPRVAAGAHVHDRGKGVTRMRRKWRRVTLQSAGVLLVAATAFLAAGCGGGGNSKRERPCRACRSRSARVRAPST